MYLQHQEEVDIELAVKLQEYQKALDEERAVFEDLIKEAYSADIKSRIKASVDVARRVGVDEAEILDSTEKIDEFFL